VEECEIDNVGEIRCRFIQPPKRIDAVYGHITDSLPILSTAVTFLPETFRTERSRITIRSTDYVCVDYSAAMTGICRLTLQKLDSTNDEGGEGNNPAGSEHAGK
jgi:hypothetical protein